MLKNVHLPKIQYLKLSIILYIILGFIMTYTLANGTSVDLSKISEISEIRDIGYDETTIEKSLIKFTIRFHNGSQIPVMMHYHFNDWHLVIKELRKIRSDLFSAWESFKTKA
jgi:hypothetical protein